MKLLALSDIHSNLVAVRRMRAQEANTYDAIVVAGDLGNAGAAGVLDILASFKCPVLYVFGNWDNQLAYDSPPLPDCHLINLNVVTIGGYHFSGFSGCPTSWGQNPIGLKLEDTPDRRERTLHLHRQALARTLRHAQADPLRTIVVTHERLTRFADIAPGARLHLFGHVHGFSDTAIRDTRFVNVSVLDRQVTACRHAAQSDDASAYRNFNAGNYVVIEISADRLTVEPRVLPHDYARWTPLRTHRHNGLAWIDEESEWTHPSDPPRARYREALSPGE